MLQAIRDRAQGWIAWVIVILITIPFALWGIQEYLGIGGPPVKASVNDKKITEREFENSYRQYRESIKRQMGSNYRPEMIDEGLLREEVLNAMISSELMYQFASGMGMRLGDQMVQDFISQQPAFQVDGKFDLAMYERGLQSQGLTAAGFVEQVRRVMLIEQLHRAITDSAILTTTELEENIRLRWQRRKAAYMTVPTEQYLNKVLVEAAAIEEFYQQQQSSFMAPERVRLDYIELDIERIAKTLQADDATLRSYFDGHMDSYATREQRRASHILIATPEGGSADDIAVARATAEEALKRVQGGESFAAVAKELSEDPGSKDAGGDLDFFEAGVMDENFEEAAFKLSKGEISDIVKTPFGFHIIKLTDIRPAVKPPFAKVREQVKDDYLESEAERLFYEYAEKLANLSYENPDSLEPAANALGVKIQKSDWITRDGGNGIVASPKVLRAAFSDGVLLDGLNSEIVELGNEHILVLRVVEHEEQALKPLDAVKPDIESYLRQQQAAAEAKKSGQKLLQQLQSGKSMQQVASSAGLSVKQADGVARNNRELPQEVVGNIFRMPHPSADQPVFSGVELRSGDYVLIALQDITDGTMEDVAIDARRALRDGLLERNGNSYVGHMIENLMNGAEIEIAGTKAQEITE